MAISKNQEPKKVAKTEEIEVALHEQKNCKIRLEVTAEKSLIARAKNLAIKEVGKEIEIPGFRKGKAPKELVEKRYPKELETEWHRQIAREAFVLVQKVLEVPPIGSHSQIRFDLKEKTDEGAKLIFFFETEPKIPDIDLKAFHLQPTLEHKIEQKEIDEYLEQVRFFFAKWTEVTDRPIKEKDYVILDLESMTKTPPEKVFSDARFEVSKKGMAQWMKKLLLGKKVHDIVEGISGPDDEMPEKEKKDFLPQKVRVTIKKIEEAKLPDLNDAFAEQLKLKNLEDLKVWAKDHLEKLAMQARVEKETEQVQNFLLSVPFDLPEDLLEAEVKDRIQKTLAHNDNKAKWQKATNEEKSAFEISVRKSAENALRLFFVANHIFHKEKLPLTKEEIHSLIFHRHPEYEGKIAEIKEEDVHFAISSLYLIKAEEFILAQAKGKNA